MAGGSRKGFPFEREMAKRLSLWWTEDERDDVIWRSDASGGRATIRRKAGKSLKGQHGDLCSTDPCSAPLFAATIIECKRGYGRWSLLDALDRSATSKPSTTRCWAGSI